MLGKKETPPFPGGKSGVLEERHAERSRSISTAQLIPMIEITNAVEMLRLRSA
jgi:hypothetical protein